MALNRNSILTDLKETVIDITTSVDNIGGRATFRCTLRADMLPPIYQKFLDKEKEFHDTNPNLLRAWNINTKSWFQFNTEQIIYVEDVNYNY